MADYLRELFENVESYEKAAISYREAKAVNSDIMDRIKKEYGDVEPMRAIIAQLEKSSLLMLKETKIKREVENKKKGLYPGDWVDLNPERDLYIKACLAYKEFCENGTPLKDRDGNVISAMGLIYTAPSQSLSDVGRKYVHLRNSNGDIARYVIKTGEIIV